MKKQEKSKKNNKKKKFKKTKLGKLLFLFSNDKNNYSFSEVFGITIISLILGAFTCLSVLTIIFGGTNYFKLSKELGKFYDAYVTLSDNYYGSVDKNSLIDAAIYGMADSVGDVYTNYSDVEDTTKFDQLVTGTYEGIGCTIAKSEDKIIVVDVYDNTPAQKSGLKRNDIIAKVDDIDASTSTSIAISNYIKYEAKGKINMVIIRDKEEITITLERAEVEIPAIGSQIYEKNGKKIGYISISIFSSVSSKQFENKLKELNKQNIDGLVLDVRGNSGGYLSSVTEISSLLLPKGKIIYQVEKDNKTKITKDTTKEHVKYPIAILVNGGSASASEILAGVIKESYEGYVVGTKTYGKGTVQQVKKLSDGSMIKYTIENWLTPLGNWIDKEGITPTHIEELSEEYYKKLTVETDNQLQKALELVSN